MLLLGVNPIAHGMVTQGDRPIPRSLPLFVVGEEGVMVESRSVARRTDLDEWTNATIR